jgi:hypothetical protein
MTNVELFPANGNFWDEFGNVFKLEIMWIVLTEGTVVHCALLCVSKDYFHAFGNHVSGFPVNVK